MAQQLCPGCGSHWPLGPTHCSTCGSRLVPQYHFVQRPRRRGLTLNDLIVFGMLCLFSPLLFAVTIYALGAVAIMAPFLFMPCLAACILVGRRPGDDARAWSARLGFLGAGLAALAPVGVKLMLSM